MTENSKLHRFFTVEYKGTIYYRFDTYGPEYTVWMKVDKADQVDNVDVYNFLEMVYENVDLDIIKECRQTGRTRTTTKNLLEKAYYEQMTNEIDISKVLIEGDTATIMGEKYKRIEEPKSPAEKAYYSVYGWYPPTTSSVSNYEDNRWRDFQNGYNAAYEEKVVEKETEPEDDEWTIEKLQEKNWYVDAKTLLKPKEPEKWDVVRESVKWCEEHREESVEDWVKPQPTDDKNFKNSLDLIREWGEKNKPPTLKELLWEWWEDIFTRNSDLDADASIDYLVDILDRKFIPPSSDRNGYEWEKCLKMMRDKLR